MAHHWHDVTRASEGSPHNVTPGRSHYGLYKELHSFVWDYSLPLSGSLNMVMTLTPLLSILFLLELCAYGWAKEVLEKRNPSDFLCTCNEVADAISGASQVFFSRECAVLSLVMALI